jgi:hypothetical protein
VNLNFDQKYFCKQGVIERLPNPAQGIKEISKKGGEMAKLKCNKCGAIQDIPIHCGQPMIVTEINERTMLACRMGAACGVTKQLPKHCGQPMVAVEEG